MCKSISVKGYSIATIDASMHKNWKPLIKDGNSIRIQRTFKNTKEVLVWIQETLN